MSFQKSPLTCRDTAFLWYVIRPSQLIICSFYLKENFLGLLQTVFEKVFFVITICSHRNMVLQMETLFSSVQLQGVQCKLKLYLLRCCFCDWSNCLFLSKAGGCSQLVEQGRALTCSLHKVHFCHTRSAHESLGSIGRLWGSVLRGMRILQTPSSLQNGCIFYTHCWQVALRGEIWNLCLIACVPTVLMTVLGSK